VQTYHNIAGRVCIAPISSNASHARVLYNCLQFATTHGDIGAQLLSVYYTQFLFHSPFTTPVPQGDCIKPVFGFTTVWYGLFFCRAEGIAPLRHPVTFIEPGENSDAFALPVPQSLMPNLPPL
jgi:hypothetical protein